MAVGVAQYSDLHVALQAEMKKGDYILGVHPVVEMLKSGHPIAKIFMFRGISAEVGRLVSQMAAAQSIPVSRVPKEKLDTLSRGNHQGIIAMASPFEFIELDAALMHVYELGEEPLLLVSDGITDVGNIGAMARSLHCFGGQILATGIGNSAPLGDAALKTSAGALSHLLVSRFKSIEGALKTLAGNGVETIGLSEKANDLLEDYHPSGPVAIVMGDEEKGLSDASLKGCSRLVKIPLKGNVGSLNVSVAAGIALNHITRHR